MPTATVRLKCPDGRLEARACLGSGPVDACFKAIDSIIQADATLLEYSVRAVTEGIDALGEVNVRIRPEESSGARLNPQHGGEHSPIFHGHGADTDIIVASARAYLAALNRMLVATGAVKAQAATG
jgi:2-isopropylmalate synthase